MRTQAQAPTTSAPIELDAADPRLADAIGAAVRDGAVIVRGVDVRDDDALLGLVAHVARPSQLGNGGGFIYDVMPRPEAEQVDLSSTARPFPLHTDSTYLFPPHHIIALGCLEAPEDGGGESHLLHVDVALAHLRQRDGGDDAREALGEAAYPFPVEIDGGPRFIAPLPILDGKGNAVTVRYRDDIITKAGETASIALDARHRAALDQLQAVLDDVRLHAVLVLRPGDVLITDNHRVLHGRTAIAPGARRVMRRVKAFL